ncbi:MAG: UDP-N-acetylglucosamine 1-carboxyvinyltransferase [Alphaproteobacteria bacterium]|nr:UDP-N-acetylglucosamine 1-carboxyvinyltransferase [Alphaproteobacteria bacterium]
MQQEQENTWASVELPSPASKKTPAKQLKVTNDNAGDGENAAQDGLEKIRIEGGHALNGTIAISGAKNAALPLMCVSLLTEAPITFNNMPLALRDIQTMSELLQHLGVQITVNDGKATLQLQGNQVDNSTAPYDLVRKMRASILVLGPLLARTGHAKVSLPGGCAIGTRPVDLHIMALEAMGAKIRLEDGYIVAEAPNGLKGAKIAFPKVTVTGTENVMMAAALADGETVINNAAMEPEVTDLGECLVKMGVEIEGLGTSRLVIRGQKKLHAATHDVIADRIETGTFMIAVALCGGNIRLKKARPDTLRALIGLLETAGVTITEEGEDVIVSKPNGKRIKGIDIMTEPYPAFPTDLQAQFMTMLTLAEGAGMVTETIFENRFMHVPELVRMGANITTQGNSAIIRGVEKLKGAPVMATDLRASVALVLAGLVAEGETFVHRIYHLDRGYERVVEKLAACGAVIERVR